MIISQLQPREVVVPVENNPLIQQVDNKGVVFAAPITPGNYHREGFELQDHPQSSSVYLKDAQLQMHANSLNPTFGGFGGQVNNMGGRFGPFRGPNMG